MSLVQVSRTDGAAVVAFARPPANAFNLALVEEFSAWLEELSNAPPRDGLIITGSGAAFSGGVDFKEAPRYSPDQKRRMVQAINRTITLLYGFPGATVAAVNGHAIGGAFVVMLGCDARLGARSADTKLALSEVTAGIPYPACPMEVVKAELQPQVRRILVLTGKAISPEEAHALGIIDELVPPDRLIARAVEVARSRSALPSYLRVKEQLKRDTLRRMSEIVATRDDPMLDHWV
ncbi:MAG: enoyl-CoA hydratase/isomerase family protein [Alphaproteobacteria bacterium]|nr:enoyl-CoA hydratase/isomerase family protein [Alphaproteobacteria bacterium]